MVRKAADSVAPGGVAPALSPEPEPAAGPTDFRGRLLEAIPSRALRLELLRYRALEVEGASLVLVPPAEGLAPLLDPTKDPHKKQLLAAASELHGSPLELEVRGSTVRPVPVDLKERDQQIDAKVRRNWPGAERVDF